MSWNPCPRPVSSAPSTSRNIDAWARPTRERYSRRRSRPKCASGARCEEVVALGKASERILSTAADKTADIIVMGVRGRGAIDVLAFGSTTNDVIRRAACPVLAVHPHAKDPRRLAALPATVMG